MKSLRNDAPVETRLLIYTVAVTVQAGQPIEPPRAIETKNSYLSDIEDWSCIEVSRV